MAANVDMQNAGVGISLIAQRNLNVDKEIYVRGGDVHLQSDADNNGPGGGDNNGNGPPAADIQNILSQLEDQLDFIPEGIGQRMFDEGEMNNGANPGQPVLGPPENGNINIFAPDGTQIGEINQGGSGKNLIVAMQNAGYSPDQITNVFVQAAEAGIKTSDVTVFAGQNLKTGYYSATPATNSIAYNVGNVVISMSSNGELQM